MRLGQRKPGYGGVVIAVVEALREADMALHVTLEGRQPGAAFQVLEGENPSWWAVK